MCKRVVLNFDLTLTWPLTSLSKIFGVPKIGLAESFRVPFSRLFSLWPSVRELDRGGGRICPSQRGAFGQIPQRGAGWGFWLLVDLLCPDTCFSFSCFVCFCRLYLFDHFALRFPKSHLHLPQSSFPKGQNFGFLALPVSATPVPMYRQGPMYKVCSLGRTSQNWPDIRSPISKFRDKHCIDTVTDSNGWKFQGDQSFGVAMTNIPTFSEVRSIDVTWRPELDSPGSKSFSKRA